MTTNHRNQYDTGWECPHCKMKRGKDKIDPCLGKLPGVLYGCCGHGGHGDTRGYIYFENGKVIRFNFCEAEDYTKEEVKASKAMKELIK